MHLSATLPRTKTNAWREARWRRMSATSTLLEVWEGSTSKNATMTGRYFVREHQATYCRRFQIFKELSEGGGHYWVGIGATTECDCHGFQAHSICKHTDAIVAMIKAGEFSGRAAGVGCFDPDQDTDYLMGDIE